MILLKLDNFTVSTLLKLQKWIRRFDATKCRGSHLQNRRCFLIKLERKRKGIKGLFQDCLKTRAFCSPCEAEENTKKYIRKSIIHPFL